MATSKLENPSGLTLDDNGFVKNKANSDIMTDRGKGLLAVQDSNNLYHGQIKEHETSIEHAAAERSAAQQKVENMLNGTTTVSAQEFTKAMDDFKESTHHFHNARRALEDTTQNEVNTNNALDKSAYVQHMNDNDKETLAKTRDMTDHTDIGNYKPLADLASQKDPHNPNYREDFAQFIGDKKNITQADIDSFNTSQTAKLEYDRNGAMIHDTNQYLDMYQKFDKKLQQNGEHLDPKLIQEQKDNLEKYTKQQNDAEKLMNGEHEEKSATNQSEDHKESGSHNITDSENQNDSKPTLDELSKQLKERKKEHDKITSEQELKNNLDDVLKKSTGKNFSELDEDGKLGSAKDIEKDVKKNQKQTDDQISDANKTLAQHGIAGKTQTPLSVFYNKGKDEALYGTEDGKGTYSINEIYTDRQKLENGTDTERANIVKKYGDNTDEIRKTATYKPYEQERDDIQQRAKQAEENAQKPEIKAENASENETSKNATPQNPVIDLTKDSGIQKFGIQGSSLTSIYQANERASTLQNNIGNIETNSDKQADTTEEENQTEAQQQTGHSIAGPTSPSM